jgi:hypothetical protein
MVFVLLKDFCKSNMVVSQVFLVQDLFDLQFLRKPQFKQLCVMCVVKKHT